MRTTRNLVLLTLLGSGVLIVSAIAFALRPRLSPIAPKSEVEMGIEAINLCLPGDSLSDKTDECLAYLFNRARAFEGVKKELLAMNNPYKSLFEEHASEPNLSLDRSLYIRRHSNQPLDYATDWHAYLPSYPLSNGLMIYKIYEAGPFKGMCSAPTMALAKSVIEKASGEKVTQDDIALNAYFEMSNYPLGTTHTQVGDSLWKLVDRALTQRFGKDFTNTSSSLKSAVIDSLIHDLLFASQDPRYLSQNFRAQFGKGLKTADVIYPGYLFYDDELFGYSTECFWTGKTESGRDFMVFESGEVREL